MAAIVCLGIVVRDLVFAVPALPPRPVKLTAKSLRVEGGGMAASAAVTAASLGGQVAYWGRFGDDAEGRSLRADLQQRGIEVPAPTIAGTQTPTAAVLVADNGERLLAVFRGQLDDDPGWLPLHDVSRFQAALVDFRWQRGASALLRAARVRGLSTVLDADVGDADAVRSLLPDVQHAVFSEAALAEATGHAEIETALRHVQALGPDVVAVTLGEHGSMFLLNDRVHRIPAVPVKVRDSNGAGDTFHGAYTLALAEGRTVLDAAYWASAVAALKCRNGSGWSAAPDRAGVEQLMENNPWQP
jgi:sulfofructose kinase